MRTWEGNQQLGSQEMLPKVMMDSLWEALRILVSYALAFEDSTAKLVFQHTESSLELPSNVRELLKIRIPPPSARSCSQATKKAIQKKISQKAARNARKSGHHRPSTSPAKQRPSKASSSKEPERIKANSHTPKTRRVFPRPNFEDAIRDWPIGGTPASQKSTRERMELEAGREKRGRGRPPKDLTEELLTPLTEWSVLVYIHVEKPSRVVQTSKRAPKKLEIPEPDQHGPITVTHTTTWRQFLKEVSRASKIALENVPIQTMRWSILPPTTTSKAPNLNDLRWLPISSEVGYRDFVKSGIEETKGKARFLLSMASALLIDKPMAGSQKVFEDSGVVSDESEDDGRKPAKKKTKRVMCRKCPMLVLCILTNPYSI